MRMTIWSVKSRIWNEKMKDSKRQKYANHISFSTINYINSFFFLNIFKYCRQQSKLVYSYSKWPNDMIWLWNWKMKLTKWNNSSSRKILISSLKTKLSKNYDNNEKTIHWCVYLYRICIIYWKWVIIDSFFLLVDFSVCTFFSLGWSSVYANFVYLEIILFIFSIDYFQSPLSLSKTKLDSIDKVVDLLRTVRDISPEPSSRNRDCSNDFYQEKENQTDDELSQSIEIAHEYARKIETQRTEIELLNAEINKRVSDSVT